VGEELALGMREVLELAGDGENEAALERAQTLLEPNAFTKLRGSLATRTGGYSEMLLSAVDAPLAWMGLETRTPRDRAAVQLARGVLLHRLERGEEALTALAEARLLGGDGPVRLDATYDLGCLALQEGERQRALIPEISGATAPAPVLPPTAAPPAKDSEAPDPLKLARAAYLRAREHLLERLRADWQDGDTRANVELVLRRLRELAEVEQEREQEQDQQQQDQQDQKSEKSDESSESEKGEDSQDQDSPPEEQEESEEEQPSEEESPEESPQEGSEEESEDPSEAEGQEVQEQELTREEVQRLLQRLLEHEKEGEDVRSRLQRMRRIPVKRDW
jgi:hypothetical protein